MPTPLAQRLTPRRTAALTLTLAAAGITAAAAPTTAMASSSQITIIQDGGEIGGSAANTFQQFRELGATTARVIIPWSQIAPEQRSFTKPAGFNAADPNAYGQAWAPYDAAVEAAAKYGITVDFTVTGGAPQWAEAKLPNPPGYNAFFAYKPNAKEYGKFFTAVATRYSGHFRPAGSPAPLPRVHFWALFNEPNFGEDLGPQAIKGSRVSVAPGMYRQLLNAAWSALRNTGHGHDTTLVGGYAARGMQGRPGPHAPQGFPGNFAQTKPLLFLRTLYCVGTNNKPLRGKTAKAESCPTNAKGSRKFRKQNPALFSASGAGVHPYPDTGSPTNDGKGDPNFATFPDLGKFGVLLSQLLKVYGSHRSLPIYNDEYGYITRPPANRSPTGRLYPTPDKAATFINQAEYLSFKNPRLKSYMQYLVHDPPPSALLGTAGFASGLIFTNGVKKATYFAFNLPIWMPKTSFSHKKKAEVWGDARPAVFEPNSRVQIQFQKGGTGAFTTLKTVKVKRNGYFDTKMRFPSSGNVQLAFTYSHDPLLPTGVGGSTVFSRIVKIKVH